MCYIRSVFPLDIFGCDVYTLLKVEALADSELDPLEDTEITTPLTPRNLKLDDQDRSPHAPDTDVPCHHRPLHLKPSLLMAMEQAAASAMCANLSARLASCPFSCRDRIPQR